MSGGKSPTKSGDSYFGFYTMAMTTGKPRDANTHAKVLSKAGFKSVKIHKGARSFITSVVTARKPK
jgi:demethylspheroidene O-methyltransferase